MGSNKEDEDKLYLRTEMRGFEVLTADFFIVKKTVIKERAQAVWFSCYVWPANSTWRSYLQLSVRFSKLLRVLFLTKRDFVSLQVTCIPITTKTMRNSLGLDQCSSVVSFILINDLDELSFVPFALVCQLHRTHYLVAPSTQIQVQKWPKLPCLKFHT